MPFWRWSARDAHTLMPIRRGRTPRLEGFYLVKTLLAQLELGLGNALLRANSSTMG